MWLSRLIAEDIRKDFSEFNLSEIKEDTNLEWELRIWITNHGTRLWGDENEELYEMCSYWAVDHRFLSELRLFVLHGPHRS